MFQGNSAKRFLGSNVQMYRGSSVRMFQDNNVRMFQGNLVGMFLVSSARMSQDRNATKSVKMCSGVKFATMDKIEETSQSNQLRSNTKEKDERISISIQFLNNEYTFEMFALK